MIFLMTSQKPSSTRPPSLLFTTGPFWFHSTKVAILDQTSQPSELDNPAWRLHPLRGDLAGHWSIRVTGNMRLVFRFDRGEAVDVDLVDCH